MKVEKLTEMNSESNLKDNAEQKLDLSVFVYSLTVVLLIVLLITLFPSKANSLVGAIYDFITDKVGVLYTIIYIITLVFSFWLAFSRYGKVVLGSSKEEFSDFDWAIMLICTGLAGSLMVFGIIEPLNFLMDPPFGIEKMSDGAFEYAHMCGQYYWGVSYWALCVPVAVFIGYFLYVREEKTARVGQILANRGILNSAGALIVDVLGVIATLGGVSTSMIFSTPLLSSILCRFTGINDREKVTVFVLMLWLILFVFSVWRGLDKGIKFLSRINVFVFSLFLLFLVIIINPITVIKWETNSLGLYIQNFIRMSFYTDPLGNDGFPERWSVFYYAYDMAYVLIIGVFIGRISRGKSLRKMVLGTIGYGTIGALCGFSILSCFSLEVQRKGVVDLVTFLQNEGNEAAVIGALESLPFTGIVLLVYAALSLIFMATTTDSTAFTLSLMTSKNWNCDDRTGRKNRIVWAVVIIVLTLSFLQLKGAQTMRTISMIAAFPMIFIQAIVMLTLAKDLRDNHNAE
ncbi:BCCT family transporter [Butyrivibrio sp. WCD3002]|uniref:BCCT family transporter n=1 Tax=Butyrivibrio sp. WCD3002 TaxID=1280676 RepID=UPI00047B8B4F|nr:BCCT family transporter [Butyrivibrio sp. WCD3002]